MWYYNNKEFNDIPVNIVGFVYLITNLTNNKKYIGKKNFYFSKTKYKMHTQKNGIKKRKRIRELIESDWKTYYGSNKQLNEDVIKLGEKKFKREIIYLCSNKAEMTYYEALEQFNNNVLLSNEYYNDWIMCRITKKNLGLCK